MDCLKFDGFLNQWGYGMCWYKGGSQLAHRVAYVEARGLPIEDIKGQIVRHTCDNPSCVNPEHLEAGTQVDNMQDMRERGREGDARNFGAANGRTVLSPDDVLVIRAQYVKGSKEFGLPSLARKFGVGTSQIHRVVKGVHHV